MRPPPGTSSTRDPFVSRADLIGALAERAGKPEGATADDRDIADEIATNAKGGGLTATGMVTVVVRDGVMRFRGVAVTIKARKALAVVAAEVSGTCARSTTAWPCAPRSACHLVEPTRTLRPATQGIVLTGGRAECGGGSVNLHGMRSIPRRFDVIPRLSTPARLVHAV